MLDKLSHLSCGSLHASLVLLVNVIIPPPSTCAQGALRNCIMYTADRAPHLNDGLLFLSPAIECPGGI